MEFVRVDMHKIEKLALTIGLVSEYLREVLDNIVLQDKLWDIFKLCFYFVEFEFVKMDRAIDAWDAAICSASVIGVTSIFPELQKSNRAAQTTTSTVQQWKWWEKQTTLSWATLGQL